ncbi:hypothetical protein ACFFLM_22030 [Deinococcus oregonensis]|uniref:SnoaL-like domain-containing protein n=1 Tax=Deinococcus oregonensis TaxID=1805970 RepID=A0ABV6B8B9_9DEIO
MSTPEEIVVGQFNALNARDIEAFMSFWWEDAQFYEHPSRLMADGAPRIRRRMLESFERRDALVELVSRLNLGERIIEHVFVNETGSRGPMKVHMAALYKVAGEKMKTAWFTVSPVARPPQMLA